MRVPEGQCVLFIYLNHTHNGRQLMMINNNNRLIYKHELIVDIITLINSNIINDIVNIIIILNPSIPLFDLVKIKVCM